MSHDLFLGFKEEPKNLDEVLKRLEFQPSGSTYTFHDPYCKTPIRFSYSGKIEDPEFWGKFDPKVQFEAFVTCSGGDQYEFDKHLELAKNNA